MTARPTPCNPCLPSFPLEKNRYPAAENSVLPDLRVSCRPMKSQPTCRAFANTHSACPYRFFPFTECAHCRSLPPQVPLSVLLGPRVLQPLPADAWSDHSVFFCLFFPYFPFYRDIGFSFPSPVHALISDGWVQPSQPTPTPTLSSSLSVFAYPRYVQPLLSTLYP